MNYDTEVLMNSVAKCNHNLQFDTDSMSDAQSHLLNLKNTLNKATWLVDEHDEATKQAELQNKLAMIDIL